MKHPCRNRNYSRHDGHNYFLAKSVIIIGARFYKSLLPEIGFSKHLIQVIVRIVREKKLIAACSDDVLWHGQTVFVRCTTKKTERGKDFSVFLSVLSVCPYLSVRWRSVNSIRLALKHTNTKKERQRNARVRAHTHTVRYTHQSDR